VAGYLVQALLGAANVQSRLSPAAVLGHASLAFGVWSCYVVLAVLAMKGAASETAPTAGASTGIRERLTAYVALTKPRIIMLLLVTTVPAMVLAKRGLPSLWLVLKRSTTQNIVIGGAAGAVPVLVGWAAVTGRLSAAAWVMFAIVFLWTPPHFWALAMRYRDDYARAGVPMLPVVKGERRTATE